jgi:hypothetical protein
MPAAKKSVNLPFRGAEKAPAAKAQKPGAAVAGGRKVSSAGKKGGKSFLSVSVPLYLCILLVLASFLAGIFFAYNVLPPQDPDTCLPQDTVSRTVEVILLYSDECTLCETGHSILDVFEDRAIPYTVDKIEASTAEGKKLIAKYNVKELPTALVDYEKIHLYTTTATGISQRFSRVMDKYVVKELNLNVDEYYPVMLLQAMEGCPAADKNVSVILFDDLYTRISVVNREKINSTLEKFAGDLNFEYVYFPSVRSDEEGLSPEELETAKMIGCAQQQGRYLDFEHNLRSVLCNVDGNESGISERDMLYCASGEGALETLDFAELEEVRDRTDLVDYVFDTCLETSEKLIEKWESAVFGYDIDKRGVLPVALAGCSYLVTMDDLENAVCLSDPSLADCNTSLNP